MIGLYEVYKDNISVFLKGLIHSVLFSSFFICSLIILFTGLPVSLFNVFQYIVHKDSFQDLLLSEQTTSWIGYIYCVCISFVVVMMKIRRGAAVRSGICIFMVVTFLVHVAFIYFGQAYEFVTLTWLIKNLVMVGACWGAITAGRAFSVEVTSVFSSLTQREMEVVNCVFRGKCNRDIAKELFISEGTVKLHISHILDKTGFKNRTEIAVGYLKGVKVPFGLFS